MARRNVNQKSVLIGSVARTRHLKAKRSVAGPGLLHIVIPKKFGIAVERNQLRRRIKEALRQFVDIKKEGGTIMIFPAIELKKCDFQTIKAELGEALRQLGLLTLT